MGVRQLTIFKERCAIESKHLAYTVDGAKHGIASPWEGRLGFRMNGFWTARSYFTESLRLAVVRLYPRIEFFPVFLQKWPFSTANLMISIEM